jgi:esterase/lipase superfamily enzyme
MSDGIAIRGAELDMDFQSLSGLGWGRVYAIKKGKKVARISGAGFLFRSPDLWTGLLALGGNSSAARFGASAEKGEPAQTTYHSVTAVPAAVRQLTLIDILRKA